MRKDDRWISFHLLIQVTGKNVIKKLVEVLAIPPAVHIRLAKSNGKFPNNSRVKSLVMDLYVPWTIAVDPDVCRTQ
jgi:hypothetical protein